jgi:hypothetical protein
MLGGGGQSNAWMDTVEWSVETGDCMGCTKVRVDDTVVQSRNAREFTFQIYSKQFYSSMLTLCSTNKV